MDHAIENWEHICELLSIVLEVAGVFRMAQRYIRMAASFTLVIQILISSLFKGPVARGAAIIGQVNEDRALYILQGLALIAIGFLLRAIPHCAALAKHWL